MKNGSVSGTELVEDDHERASSPPEGEDEFTDDDGTRYKWDKAVRVWVPQVRLYFVNRLIILSLFLLFYWEFKLSTWSSKSRVESFTCVILLSCSWLYLIMIISHIFICLYQD